MATVLHVSIISHISLLPSSRVYSSEPFLSPQTRKIRLPVISTKLSKMRKPSSSTNFVFPETEEKIQDLMVYTSGGSWDEVVDMYKKLAWTHRTTINDSQDTALHVAVDNRQEESVAQLVKAIVHEEGGKEPETSAIAAKNVRGDTPLHLAASRGFAKICYCIVGENKERAHLLRVRNKRGESPLFLAALNWQKDAFLYLYHCSPDITAADLTRNDRNTILHTAIQREYFDLAVVIIHLLEELISRENEDGVTPLKMLATKPLAFKSSSNNLGWLDKLLYRCILVEQVDVDTAAKSPPESTLKFDVPDDTPKRHPENYETCYGFVRILLNIAGLDGYFREKQQGDTENPKTQEKNQKLESLPPNYETFREFLKFLKSVYVSAAGLSGLGLSRVKEMKEKHEWSSQVLDLLTVEPSYAYVGRGGGKPARIGESPGFPQNPMTDNQGEEENMTNSQDKGKTNDEIVDKILKGITMAIHDTKKTNNKDEIDESDSPLLIAARYGIPEIVDKILTGMPMVFLVTTSNFKRNILLAAVESRQPLLVQTLRKHKLWGNLILGVDTEENTVLHLAARKSKYGAWQIPGSFMQMIWDIKWYQYIRDHVPHHFLLRTNKQGKTPPEIFAEEHEHLVKDSGEWLKDTSESCSFVAALIAGVAFATSSTIPGGNNEQTGKPNYEGQPAFNVFAITSLVALCFSVTALIMFLAILTSRKLAKDFRRDLPFKLLLGLSSLFISIASMLVAFCAGHFFVVEDKFKDILFPIYAATCLPVSFYAMAQFPLYIDLLTTIITEVPQPRNTGSEL